MFETENKKCCECMLLFVFCAGTSSIDTTCTIWGLETGQVLGRVNLVTGHVKTQLIAHDKEVKVMRSNFIEPLSFKTNMLE